MDVSCTWRESNLVLFLESFQSIFFHPSCLIAFTFQLPSFKLIPPIRRNSVAGTYRFLSVIRQTAVLIGEPKHGIWRVQDNGHVREWRRHGKVGLDKDVDPNSDSLTEEQMRIIRENYASFIPEEGFGAYKLPEDQFIDGYHNYIDLTIYHPKYDGKYDDHEPIDLAHFYCTMSQAGFPHEIDVWKYAMGQPLVNKVGPLGKRAGA